jgi:hypothetical protein
MSTTKFKKAVIGRAEPVHFMDLDIVDVPAKVDSGAYRSAVHASHIKLSDDGKTLTFKLLGGHKVFGSLAQQITVKDFSIVNISNSFGHREDRYEITLRVKVGKKFIKTTFSLANRENMVYPILLGRKLLNRRFLINTSKTGVDRLALKRRYNIEIPDEEEQRYEDSNLIARPR